MEIPKSRRLRSNLIGPKGGRSIPPRFRRAGLDLSQRGHFSSFQRLLPKILSRIFKKYSIVFTRYTHEIACSTAMTPEERARQQIDLLLQQSGWIVQDRSGTNLAAGPGVAIREALLKGGEADYLLFAGGKAIATVEAKPEGYTLTGVEGQSGKYATGLLDIYPRWSDPLPFAYESTGSETRFTNRLDRSNSLW